MAVDLAGGGRAVIEVLDDTECLARLASQPVGRLGFSSGALPVVLPINFTIEGRRAVFATEVGAKLDAARSGDVACLEVDGYDTFAHEGWSVLATGTLHVLEDEAEVAHATRLPVSPWAANGRITYVELTIELLTGRMVRRA